MKLVTIILNYRTPEMAVKAAEAALREMGSIPGSKLLLVDNDSGDGSFERMSEAARARGWGDRAEVLQTGHNGGFGFGNNYGIKRALGWKHPPAYLYLLNADAFPEPGCIAGLVKFLDEHPDAGFAGSGILGTDGLPHAGAFRFPSVASELDDMMRFGPMSRLLEEHTVPVFPIPMETTRVDWVSGCSMMVRREVFEQAGLFDETFFLYYEETDLCRRGLRAGWRCYTVPSCRVVHVGSASTGHQDLNRPRASWWFDSREHYFRKNHGEAYWVGANLAWLVGASFWKLRRVVQPGIPSRDPPGLLRDFVRHNFLKPLTRR